MSAKLGQRKVPVLAHCSLRIKPLVTDQCDVRQKRLKAYQPNQFLNHENVWNNEMEEKNVVDT